MFNYFGRILLRQSSARTYLSAFKVGLGRPSSKRGLSSISNRHLSHIKCNPIANYGHIVCRGLTSKANGNQFVNRNRSTVLYVSALAVTVLGFSYAAVPLYRLYCQASGLGGTVKQTDITEKIENMDRQEDRILTIRFNADTSSTMQWHFKPQQTEVKVAPGETALAFYTATNPTDQAITGISTYNVVPFEAGQYFNKIQCFCFEEQRLNPQEQVDMPVFFFIDPEFTEDPAMARISTIILSYTFFESKEAEKHGL